ncbi:MAG: hypothetical protein WCF67_10810 [Chitinophagaceae bacterium]
MGSSSKAVRWVVGKNSSLYIQGKTNVNRFTCNIDQYAENDTIICFGEPLKQVRLSGALQLNVSSFNCHSRLITKDFRKTIKAEKYPVLTIRFLSLESMPALQSESESIKGWVEIELAGVVKKFELNYSFSKTPSGSIQLIGERRFSFSDFNLLPAKKLGGVIKIKDAFDVKFQLTLQPLQ